jgi:hypothetical protein
MKAFLAGEDIACVNKADLTTVRMLLNAYPNATQGM